MRFAANHFSRLTLASVIALLCACGGGGGGHHSAENSNGGSNNGGGNTSAPTQTGTLTDSAVAGVRYETSGGYSGTTDAQGHFLYNVGETVTFKIGDLTLGEITPSGTEATVTPIELATSAAGVVNTDKVTNLLVLLQSLDSDGDPDNGINIPASAATAITGNTATSIQLDTDPTSFSSNPNLTSVVQQANGSSATVVSTAQALDHFKENFLNQLAGTWVFAPGSEEKIVFRFNKTGDYIMGEYAPEDDSGGSGIERGTIAWEPTTGEITADNFSVDTNGEWGLSHPYDEKLFLALEGENTLLVTIKEGDEQEVLRLSRVQASSNDIGGLWAKDDGTNFGKQQFIFFATGQYMMLDPVGDEDEVGCGEPGLELGSYLFSNNQLSFSNIVEDTNGCAGVHDDEDDSYGVFTTTLDNANGKLTAEADGDTFSLYREGVAPTP